MRASLGWMLLAAWVVPALGQYASTSEKLLITAKTADTWVDGQNNIVQLRGPVSIEMDDETLTADDAVIWLTPVPGGLLQEQEARIALIGNAVLTARDNHVTRSGPRLLVSSTLRGTIQLTADRNARDRSGSNLYRQALSFREQGGIPVEAPPMALPAPEREPATESSSSASLTISTSAAPALLPLQRAGVALSPTPSVQANKGAGGVIEFHSRTYEQMVDADNDVVVVLSGGVTITQNRDNGDFLELLANKVVLFTSLKNDQMKAVDMSSMGRKITAAYLEGDVRINLTPATNLKPEQRMTADRAYYDFPTDRAVLTDVVLHTIDPQTQIPIIVRAQKLHQLAQDEYTANKVEMTTSSFAVPTYSVRASYAYIHQEPADGAETNYDFVADDATMRTFGLPLFYLPYLSGTVNNDAFPLRGFSFGTSRVFGTSVTSEWGLFESLGKPRPRDLDLSFRVDDFSARGFGGGIDGKYNGSHINESTLDPWSFSGDFKSFIMNDKGIDNLGGQRALVTPPTDLRGMFLWEHQHFFPDDWQVQLRAGYVSDPTFLEEYYRDNFGQDLPYNASLYVKRQHDEEAITFLSEVNTTPFTTNADRQQEQFDVERLPEVGYRRIGDSIAGDDLTWFSNNSASRLRFVQSHATLLQQGFYPGLSPGIPSEGFTGTTGTPVYRGDTSQELDWPLQVGQFKVVPYALGRVTTYSDSPGGDAQTRLYSGAGVRMTTAFWKIDEGAESDLLNVHRLRHIIEPELNLYTAGTTVDRSRLFIYDEDVDGVSDISAAQLALHQRWETMRGGPGRWHSVDLFDLNVEGNFFTNQPPPGQLQPTQFRGLFFPSNPGTSVARQGINADAAWHISDTTSLLASQEWNLDQREQATASAGLSVTRDERVSYFVGDTYLQALNSQVISGIVEYRLTPKYTVQLGQSFNFGDTHDVNTVATVIRRFDTVSVSFTIYHDAVTNLSGFNFNLIPLGLKGLSGGLTGLTGQ
ncbi:MAG: LPS assembly protein LptD [Planctomycetota bacterium]|nr:LPS assembly protein LptD [Planctomycetota bacterium]